MLDNNPKSDYNKSLISDYFFAIRGIEGLYVYTFYVKDKE